jgi:hypothetical protein
MIKIKKHFSNKSAKTMPGKINKPIRKEEIGKQKELLKIESNTR